MKSHGISRIQDVLQNQKQCEIMICAFFAGMPCILSDKTHPLVISSTTTLLLLSHLNQLKLERGILFALTTNSFAGSSNDLQPCQPTHSFLPDQSHV
jgi:hypothetical protein